VNPMSGLTPIGDLIDFLVPSSLTHYVAVSSLLTGPFFASGGMRCLLGLRMGFSHRMRSALRASLALRCSLGTRGRLRMRCSRRTRSRMRRSLRGCLFLIRTGCSCFILSHFILIRARCSRFVRSRLILACSSCCFVRGHLILASSICSCLAHSRLILIRAGCGRLVLGCITFACHHTLAGKLSRFGCAEIGGLP
jgi:hypothetical protein